MGFYTEDQRIIVDSIVGIAIDRMTFWTILVDYDVPICLTPKREVWLCVSGKKDMSEKNLTDVNLSSKLPIVTPAPRALTIFILAAPHNKIFQNYILCFIFGDWFHKNTFQKFYEFILNMIGL